MRAVVVGGGLAGLVAARDLAGAGLAVTLFEASDRLGGQVHTTADWADVGAEAFLVRRPEMLQLVLELGLADEVVHPSPSARSHVLVQGRLVPLPAGTVLGIPSRLRQLRGVVSLSGIVRAGADLWLPAYPFPEDTTVGALGRLRLGSEVVEKLIDPLLGGVYSGQADSLSFTATAPALAAQSGRSIMRRAARLPSGSGGPVFASLRGGLGVVVDALIADLLARGVTVVTGAPAVRLSGGPGAWDVGGHSAEVVVLATRADVTSRLLAPVASAAAGWAAATPYAGVAVVTLIWAREGAGRLDDPGIAGWLVPRPERRLVKAVTVLTSKWPHLRDRFPDEVVVRASVGRFGDDLAAADPTWMTGVAAAEVAEVAGAGGRLLRSTVTRWTPALPQYLLGHPRRVREVRASLPEGLTVAGAAWDGVGLPAVVASARRAAAEAAESVS